VLFSANQKIEETVVLNNVVKREAPKASNDTEELTEAQKLVMEGSLTKAARFTLVSLPRQSIGRLALKYRHTGDAWCKHIAMPVKNGVIYGPQFAIMDRFSQSYVMARESMRLALGHVQLGAIHYKRDKTGFSSKVWSMACDSIINNVLENLPTPDQSRDTIKYGVRRCEALGIVKWDDLVSKLTVLAAEQNIEVGEIFSKRPGELTSYSIYQGIMRVVRAAAEERKVANVAKNWDRLLAAYDLVFSRVVEEPTCVLKSDPVDVGPIEFYDALANLVRIYNESAYPADHVGKEPVDVEDWKLLSEAVHALVEKAKADPAHVFTQKPTRRSTSLWDDLVQILRECTDIVVRTEPTEDVSDIIDELADDLDLIDTLQDAIEEAAQAPEANLINEGRQLEDSFRRMQAGLGAGDALMQVSPPSGVSRTPWRKALASYASTALITRLRIDPLKPSRRTVSSMYQSRRVGPDGKRLAHYNQPRLIRHDKAKKAAFIIDTSGSIFADRQVLEQLLCEAYSVCKRVNTVMTVIFADAEVTDVIDVGEALEMIRTLVPKGGGGTDFRPAIARAEALNPDLIIYATDLMGIFPESKPKCPVVWAYPCEFERIETPWGQRMPLVD
jgi:hypothetical protein